MSRTPNEIWIGRNDAALGPHALDKIRQLHGNGALRADDLLWWDGLSEWIERDAALMQLGVEAVHARPAPPPMPPRPVVHELPRPMPEQPYRVASQQRDGCSTSALLLGFAVLIGFAVVVAAAFVFLRTPNWSLPSLSGRNDIANVLSSAAMYKTAYAEYTLSYGDVPKSLSDLGLSSAPYGTMTGARLESGTLLFDTERGVLALQPFRNANFQILFRCGRAAAPAGMDALGMIDSADATTVPNDDLPEGCR